MYIPDVGSVTLDYVRFPTLAKGKMMQLPNGEVLAPAYSSFKGDSARRLRAYLLAEGLPGSWQLAPMAISGAMPPYF